MMKIIITLDGSYKATAARTPLTGLSVAELNSLMKDSKKQLSPAKRVEALRLRIQSTPKAKQPAIKEKIAKIREQHGLGPRTTSSTVEREIERITKALDKAKAKQKASKSKPKQTKGRTDSKADKETRNWEWLYAIQFKGEVSALKRDIAAAKKTLGSSRSKHMIEKRKAKLDALQEKLDSLQKRGPLTGEAARAAGEAAKRRSAKNLAAEKRRSEKLIAEDRRKAAEYRRDVELGLRDPL